MMGDALVVIAFQNSGCEEAAGLAIDGTALRCKRFPSCDNCPW
jgi:hypothetical protein